LKQKCVYTEAKNVPPVRPNILGHMDFLSFWEKQTKAAFSFSLCAQPFLLFILYYFDLLLSTPDQKQDVRHHGKLQKV
jgi:hypothetical protein